MRSGTPDSVGSVGSAHSSRQTYQQPVQTGYNQSQPAQVGYIQQQTGYAAAQSANVPSYSNMAGQQYAGQQGALPREPQQQQVWIAGNIDSEIRKIGADLLSKLWRFH